MDLLVGFSIVQCFVVFLEIDQYSLLLLII